MFELHQIRSNIWDFSNFTVKVQSSRHRKHTGHWVQLAAKYKETPKQFGLTFYHFEDTRKYCFKKSLEINTNTSTCRRSQKKYRNKPSITAQRILSSRWLIVWCIVRYRILLSIAMRESAIFARFSVTGQSEYYELWNDERVHEVTYYVPFYFIWIFRNLDSIIILTSFLIFLSWNS